MSPLYRTGPRSRSADAGYVLVCVLWILAILTVITIGFSRRAMMERRAAVFTFEHAKAMYLARGAVARGIVELRNKTTIDQLYKQNGRTSYSQRWANPVDMIEEKVYFTGEQAQGDEYKKDICQYRIRDEAALVCINTADEPMLHQVPGLKQPVIRKIMARRGIEEDPNEPKQGFQTIEELRFIKGIKDKEWFGTDKEPGLRDLLTCFGGGRININTASEDVLGCVPDLSEGVIGAIINFRKGPDGELNTADDLEFISLADVSAKAGTGNESLDALNRYCAADSTCFTITGIATRLQGKVRAMCTATVAVQGVSANVIKWREELTD